MRERLSSAFSSFWRGMFGGNLVTLFTLLHLVPLRFRYVGGYWDRTQHCCNVSIGRQNALTTRLDLIHFLVLHSLFQSFSYLLCNKRFYSFWQIFFILFYFFRNHFSVTLPLILIMMHTLRLLLKSCFLRHLPLRRSFLFLTDKSWIDPGQFFFIKDHTDY